MRTSLRPATDSDSERIWRWRNDPDSVAASLHQAEVPWHEHAQWFPSALRDPDRRIYLLEADGEAVAMLRLDRRGDESWEVSINVAPEHRGRGLGRTGLSSILELVRGEALARAISAKIKKENASSLKAFTTVGFREVEQTGDVVHLVADISSDPPEAR